jgi:hypothetical protein
VIGAVVALGAAVACGGSDTTRFTTAETVGAELEPVAEESRTFAILSERESIDAVCRFVGVSGVSGSTPADRAACSALVNDCRGNVEAALGTGEAAPAVGVPPTDLEALFGCPLTLAELDRCIAGALERGIGEYGDDVSCDMPALPAIEPLTLFASPDCLGVVLQCPELVASIAAPR